MSNYFTPYYDDEYWERPSESRKERRIEKQKGDKNPWKALNKNN